MTDSVANFCIKHRVILPHAKADDFRLIQPGTITHRTLPYGSGRSGITNGVVAHVAFSSGCKHVELRNLHIVWDKKPVRGKLSKPKRPAATRGTSCKDIFKYVI